MKLGSNIKLLRKQKGLCQEHLAEAMGVSTASVSKWETNQSYPELSMLVALADFFEVSVDTLIGHRLNADRLESLLTQMDEAVNSRQEKTAAAICEKILRNYPNNSRAVERCVEGYYQLFVYTNRNQYMEQCILQTKRLFALNHGESDRERLARVHFLGNQYGLLEQWDTAKEYYEQSNVNGSSDASIASCLLKLGKPEEALTMISDALVEAMFTQFHAVNTLSDCWIALGEKEKACGALEWMYSTMESLHYNPTTMLLLQIKLAGIHVDCGNPDAAAAAIRKAAELMRQESRQEVGAAADFLRIENARKMLISTENNRELLMKFVVAIGEPFESIVQESLS